MGMWQRYAIYYTPPAPLADFGAVWLGWDVRTGKALPIPSPRIEALTRGPRRYGLHATLKAPFRLAPDTTEDALWSELAAFAAQQPAILLPAGLRLATLDGFPALIPAGDNPALTDLAAGIVRRFDHHRAPLTPEDRARRQPDRLSQPQRALLERWGYPFVMEEFRFHLTLGARLGPAEGDAVIGSLRLHLAPFLPLPFPIESLTLAGEDREGRFHQIARMPLAPAS